MAFFNSTAPASSGFRTALAAPFLALWRAMARFSETNHRMQRVQYLQSLSDEELARRGLDREKIVHHVFADMFHA